MALVPVTTKENYSIQCPLKGRGGLTVPGSTRAIGGESSPIPFRGHSISSIGAGSESSLEVPAGGSGGDCFPSSLDDASISARQLRNSKDARTKRNRRCFHRAMSGLQRGGNIRFLTLTSSPESGDIHRHFKALVMRLKRRGLLTGYIQVPAYTDSGLVHKHILFRGSYIEQGLISRWWSDLHGAPVVDIRAVSGNKRKIAGYMASYMSNQSAGHYSWDWGWVWRGFVKDWERLKHCWRCARHGWDEFSPILTGLPRWDMSLAGLLGQWRWHLQTGIPP